MGWECKFEAGLFQIIGDVRRQSLTQRTIKSSFSSRGIYPVKPELVLGPVFAKLTAENLDLRGFKTPERTPESTSSMTNSPPNTVPRVNKFIGKLTEDMKEIRDLSHTVQRRIQRCMAANQLLS